MITKYSGVTKAADVAGGGIMTVDGPHSLNIGYGNTATYYKFGRQVFIDVNIFCKQEIPAGYHTLDEHIPSDITPALRSTMVLTRSAKSPIYMVFSADGSMAIDSMGQSTTTSDLLAGSVSYIVGDVS